MGDLSITHAVPRLHPVWYSTCAYLIKRSAALTLISKTNGHDIVSSRPLVDLPAPPSHYPHAMFADHLIYRECKTYSIPLMTYTGIDSSIHSECVSGQNHHKRAITNMWNVPSRSDHTS